MKLAVRCRRQVLTYSSVTLQSPVLTAGNQRVVVCALRLHKSHTSCHTPACSPSENVHTSLPTPKKWTISVVSRASSDIESGPSDSSQMQLEAYGLTHSATWTEKNPETLIHGELLLNVTRFTTLLTSLGYCPFIYLHLSYSSSFLPWLYAINNNSSNKLNEWISHATIQT